MRECEGRAHPAVRRAGRHRQCEASQKFAKLDLRPRRDQGLAEQHQLLSRFDYLLTAGTTPTSNPGPPSRG
jgi:hypothetical protein